MLEYTMLRGFILSWLSLVAVSAQKTTCASKSDWVDLDTDEALCTMKKGDESYTLVFSDEFNQDGRTFHDGKDPKWTAIELTPSTNAQLNQYNPDNAKTSGGTLRLISQPSPEEDDQPYDTAMIQSWNKFCFTRGVVEIRAKLPGEADNAGLWPAFWLMGNLGRATFTESTNGVWPFTAKNTKCPETEGNKTAEYIEQQKISVCNPDEYEKLDLGPDPRGSPEIDIIEGMPGSEVFPYSDKAGDGKPCPWPVNASIERVGVFQPLLSTSLQLGPGIPQHSDHRPPVYDTASGQGSCLPLDKNLHWYPELYPDDDAFGNIYGEMFRTTMNYEFFGEYFEGSGLQTDSLSANSQLPKEAFEEFFTYKMEWDTDGIKWFFNDSLLFNLPASIFTSQRELQRDSLTGELISSATRRMPDEPMYLILNIDLSTRWGWPSCNPACPVCCDDCRKLECTQCFLPGFGGWTNERAFLTELCKVHEYEIDYVRVYQKDDDVSISCNPPNRRTNTWIEENGLLYTTQKTNEPLKAVEPGGGDCASKDDCGPGIQSTCQNSRCQCDSEFTGPNCLVRSAGWTKFCAEFKATEGSKAYQSNCHSTDSMSYTELKDTLDKQCQILRDLGQTKECDRAQDFKADGTLFDCSLRTRVDYVLATYYDRMGGTRCCATLGEYDYCTYEGVSFPAVMIGVVAAAVLVFYALYYCCLHEHEEPPSSKYDKYRQALVQKARYNVIKGHGDSLLIRVRDFEARKSRREGEAQNVTVWKDVWMPAAALPMTILRSWNEQDCNKALTLRLDEEKFEIYSRPSPDKEWHSKVEGEKQNFVDRNVANPKEFHNPGNAVKMGVLNEYQESQLKGVSSGAGGEIRDYDGNFNDIEAGDAFNVTLGSPPQQIVTHPEAAGTYDDTPLIYEKKYDFKAGPSNKETFWRPMRYAAGKHGRGRNKKMASGSALSLSSMKHGLYNPSKPNIGILGSSSKLGAIQEQTPGREYKHHDLKCIRSYSSRNLLLSDNESGDEASVNSFQENYQAGNSRLWEKEHVQKEVSHCMQELRDVFGFQADSCTAQQGHFIQLWRSNIGEDESPEMRKSAVHRTHNHLLSAYENWLDVTGESRTFNGVQCIQSSGLTTSKLHECCLYLCIWGEAANVRFMPELVWFLFHCARAHRQGIRFAEDDYLNHIIRPIYLRVTYERYSGFKKNGRPNKRKGRIGKLANYDDWNELFWSHSKIRENVVTMKDLEKIIKFNSIRVWEAPLEDRYALIREVDWEKSLSTKTVSTHMEYHWWYCTAASYSRVVAIHALLFALQTSADWPWELNVLEGANALSFPSIVCGIGALADLIVTRNFGYPNLCYIVFLLAPLGLYLPLRVGAFPDASQEAVSIVVVVWFCIVIFFALFSRSLKYTRKLVAKCRGSRQIDDAIHYPTSSFLFGLVFWIVVFVVKYLFSQGLGNNIRASSALIWEIGGKNILNIIFHGTILWASSFASYFVQTTFLAAIVTAISGFIYGRYQRLGASTSKVFPCIQKPSRTVERIPRRLMSKVLGRQTEDEATSIESSLFHVTWNRIVKELYKNHQLSKVERRDLIMEKGAGFVQWKNVALQIEHLENPEARRRLTFFSRSLKTRMPKAIKAGAVPSFTVLIPHYSDPIISPIESLFNEKDACVTEKMKLLCKYFPDDAQNLNTQLIEKKLCDTETVYREYEKWASMREQTLYRTVTGMLLYGEALDMLMELEGQRSKERLGKISERFQCLVAMQLYNVLSKPDSEKRRQVDQIRYLMKNNPSLEIAYLIDEDIEDKDKALDNEKRYFSCLMSERRGSLRIQLPGQPVLGNGKGDNQNHAIPFTYGRYIQAIDANQENYFEEAMKLPNLLREFKEKPIALLGLREHIFSAKLGTMSDFAGTSELVFGTLVQRVLALQYARLHYGHPDIMDKVQMMHQGGLSSATEGINLNEDIFAGMNLTLRGKRIAFKEYMQVGKARDMGFNSIMGFYEKLGRGAAEQSITRQHLRMGTRLPMHRLLSFYYGHLGFYLGHYLLSATLYLVSFMLLLFSLSDYEAEPATFQGIAGGLVSELTGPLLILMMFATTFPAFAVLWLEEGFFTALWRMLQWILTWAPVHFTFQSGVVAHSFGSTLLAGGQAAYIATGRGLGVKHENFEKLFAKYAASNIVPGMELFLMVMTATIVWRREPLPALFWVAWGIVFISWLFSPFIFNPGQFELANLTPQWSGFFKWVLNIDADSKTSWKSQRTTTLVQEPQSIVRLCFCAVALGLLYQQRAISSFWFDFWIYLPWEGFVVTFILSILDCILLSIGRRNDKEQLLALIASGFIVFDLALIGSIAYTENTDLAQSFSALWYKYFSTGLVVFFLGALADRGAHVGSKAPWTIHLRRPYIVTTFFVDVFTGTCVLVGLTLCTLPLQLVEHCPCCSCHRLFLFRTCKKGEAAQETEIQHTIEGVQNVMKGSKSKAPKLPKRRRQKRMSDIAENEEEFKEAREEGNRGLISQDGADWPKNYIDQKNKTDFKNKAPKLPKRRRQKERVGDGLTKKGEVKQSVRCLDTEIPKLHDEEATLVPKVPPRRRTKAQVSEKSGTEEETKRSVHRGVNGNSRTSDGEATLNSQPKQNAVEKKNTSGDDPSRGDQRHAGVANPSEKKEAIDKILESCDNFIKEMRNQGSFLGGNSGDAENHEEGDMEEDGGHDV